MLRDRKGVKLRKWERHSIARHHGVLDTIMAEATIACRAALLNRIVNFLNTYAAFPTPPYA
jgi:hypothetical protein